MSAPGWHPQLNDLDINERLAKMAADFGENPQRGNPSRGKPEDREELLALADELIDDIERQIAGCDHAGSHYDKQISALLNRVLTVIKAPPSAPVQEPVTVLPVGHFVKKGPRWHHLLPGENSSNPSIPLYRRTTPPSAPVERCDAVSEGAKSVTWEFDYRSSATNGVWKRHGGGVRAEPGGPPAKNEAEAIEFLRRRVEKWTADTELRLVTVAVEETYGIPVGRALSSEDRT